MLNLNKEVHRFIAETGKQPTNLYLGREEWDELAQLAQPFGVAATQQGPEFNGLRLYFVDKQSHVGLGV